jgi:hypothetical protein
LSILIGSLSSNSEANNIVTAQTALSSNYTAFLKKMAENPQNRFAKISEGENN